MRSRPAYLLALVVALLFVSNRGRVAAKAHASELEPQPPGHEIPQDPPMACGSCGEWNAPRAPFKVFGSTFFVGPQGLSSILVVTTDGLVLVDVPLPQSVAPIVERIRSLGFRPTDIVHPDIARALRPRGWRALDAAVYRRDGVGERQHRRRHGAGASRRW